MEVIWCNIYVVAYECVRNEKEAETGDWEIEGYLVTIILIKKMK